MAPTTKGTIGHADTGKQHGVSIGTPSASPKFRPHKRRTAKPKHPLWCRDFEAEVSTCEFVTKSVRKVSIEELQLKTTPATKNPPSNEGSLPHLSTTRNHNRSHQMIVSPTSSPKNLPRSASTPTSLKRRAPSMCLVGLLSAAAENKHGSPQEESSASGGVWGHFVELHEEEAVWSGPAVVVDDSPKRQHRRRRPIIHSPQKKLDGFFLAVPDVDEAVDQLRNMSF